MAIPEKIKLGGVEYSVKDNPELLELVTESRKEEKDKLYSEIKSHEAKIKVLENEKKAGGELTTAKEAELKKLQDDLAVTKAEKDKIEADLTKLKGGKGSDDDDDDDDKSKGKGKKQSGLDADKVSEIIKSALAEQQKLLNKQIEDLGGSLTKKTVGDYRKEQLEKYKGLLIEKFVPTDLSTQADVDKAVQDALEESKPYIRKEYAGEDGKKQTLSLSEIEELEAKKRATPPNGGAADPTGTYKPNGGVPPPDGGGGNLSGKELLKNVEEMSDAEYEKHREQILKEAKSHVGGDD